MLRLVGGVLPRSGGRRGPGKWLMGSIIVVLLWIGMHEYWNASSVCRWWWWPPPPPAGGASWEDAEEAAGAAARRWWRKAQGMVMSFLFNCFFSRRASPRRPYVAR